MLEFQLTHNSISTIHIWLTALLGVSFILTLVFLLDFARTRFTGARPNRDRFLLGPKYHNFSKLLLAVLASLQIFAWQLYLYRSSHDTVALWCFPVAFLGGALVWRLTNGGAALDSSLVRSLPVAFVLISFIELAGFAQATRQFSESSLFNGVGELFSNVACPGKLVEKTTVCGTTDLGSPIKLFERQLTTDAFREHIQKCRATLATMSERAMLRAQPFVQSNCHGWVFTDGRHILRGEDVQAILNENSYIEVAKPQSNDVVVYRGDDGTILHTGVVRGTLEGAIVVESKWGIGALYMHVAEEQPYSQNLTYYRTHRPTHTITIATAKPNDNLLTDQSVDDGVKRIALNPHLRSSQSK
jgi:hypothetical protein